MNIAGMNFEVLLFTVAVITGLLAHYFCREWITASLLSGLFSGTLLTIIMVLSKGSEGGSEIMMGTAAFACMAVAAVIASLVSIPFLIIRKQIQGLLAISIISAWIIPLGWLLISIHTKLLADAHPVIFWGIGLAIITIFIVFVFVSSKSWEYRSLALIPLFLYLFWCLYPDS